MIRKRGAKRALKAQAIAPERPREGWLKTAFVTVFGAGILIGGLFGFGGKILRFILAWEGNPDARFALIPIAMYFAVAFGFACIFVWAVLNGMLTDIEGPKYRMLENERELEELEAAEKPKIWA
jgi:nitrogen fixation-related uncharacterized protein